MVATRDGSWSWRSGRLQLPPTAWTPGSARRRFSISVNVRSPPMRPPSRPVETRRNVTVCSVRNPKSALSRRKKLRRRSPAPTSRTTDSATSAETRISRTSPLERGLDLLRSPRLSGREAINAGMNPKSSGVTRVIAMLKGITPASIRSSANGGITSGAKLSKLMWANVATAKPNRPPSKESNRLSVRSWRMRRPRPAPSAFRMLNSRPREVARLN